MPDVPLVPVQRPNGKTYRPRKIVVEVWDNDAWGRGHDYGVYVIGTHDVEASRPLADDAIQTQWGDGYLKATKPEQCWVRSGFHYGDPWWVQDDVRGRAAVCWTADYPD